MRFIDLFSGIGGFHKGLLNAGGFHCVFASEINHELQDIYYKNFGVKPAGDIKKVNESDIPQHDILCAGFPCQPFSLAGKKTGYKCPDSGQLIKDILRIAQYHLPDFLILENVPNILNIENGKFWEFIKKSFNKIGYQIIYKIISPLDINIPQNRKRIFILGFKNQEHLQKFQWPDKKNSIQPLSQILQHSLNHKKVESAKKKQINHWQNLLSGCNIKTLSSLSIVAPEIGATYPLDFQSFTLKEMFKYKGAYGIKLSNTQTWSSALSKLPFYIKQDKKVPDWLRESIIYTRSLYKKNKSFLSKWSKEINKTNNSWQILEWRGYKDQYVLSDHILQFRSSGIRVSKPNKFPSLVAINTTQTPIIGSEMRYISKFEAAKLQNLHSLSYMPKSESSAFKAFGNAVNAKIVELLAKQIKLVYYTH